MMAKLLVLVYWDPSLYRRSPDFNVNNAFEASGVLSAFPNPIKWQTTIKVNLKQALNINVIYF